MSSLSSARKSVSENIWAAKSHELWRSKFEYAAQILLLTDFQAKERLLAVYMSFSVCKLFCCFLTGWIEGTILLAIMNSLLRCLHDLTTELIVGKIMYKSDKQCKFYILGQGSTYLFIFYFLYFCYTMWLPMHLGFEIWGILGRVWPTEWHTCYRTHYININLSPSRCFPWHCLFQAMAWIRYTDSVTLCFVLQNVSLNANHTGASID